ncbi:MAG: hypothetical protein ACI9MR_003829, partial [Myxococcota bacterium]
MNRLPSARWWCLCLVGAALTAPSSSIAVPPNPLDPAKRSIMQPAASGDTPTVHTVPSIDPARTELGPTGVVQVDLTAEPERPWIYPKFSTGEWLVIGAGAGLTIASRIVGVAKDPLINRTGFDESIRSSVVAKDLTSQRVAQEVSDIFLTATVSYTVLVDALIVAGWFRSSPETAMQMGLIDLEAFAITAGINGIVGVLVGRERPYGRRCGGELADELIDCENDDRFRSFFSGHTSISFTAAALS